MSDGQQPAGAPKLSSAAYHIGRVKTKLSSGAYPTEATVCPCAASDDREIVARDRYGIPHRVVLCRACGILRANPRMTAAAYTEFYNTEYRPIYDTWEFGQACDAEVFRIEGLRAANFYDFIEFFDLQPRVVFDVGCNLGHLLEPFIAAGADCYGVDCHWRNTELATLRGLNVMTGGIDRLEALGKQADLIILQQVIEHFLDPLAELARLRRLLTPKGLLFVGTPGVYCSQLGLLFQNAHTFQFTADTLSYLMALAGFEEQYLDERIWSLWRPADVKLHRPRTAADHIRRYLAGERLAPLVRTVNKFPLRARKDNLDHALSLGLPDISLLEGKERGHECVVVAGGPSVDAFAADIRIRQAAGNQVIVIERMVPWCQRHDICPDYVIVLDACDDVTEALQDPPLGAMYCIATQCPPAVFEALKERTSYIFGTPQRGIDLADAWNRHAYTRTTVVNSGGSVTIGAMAMGILLGMRRFHVYGFDCHLTAGAYAQGIAGVGEPKSTIQVTVDGRVYTTTYSYLSFAQQFHLLCAMARRLGKLDDVRVYGDSLAAAMSVQDIRGDR